MADFNLDEDVSWALFPDLEHLQHDVMTAEHLRSKGTEDEAQLSVAAGMERIFITHNSKHYRMLHRAWRRWSNEWGVTPRPRHAGILIVPQSSSLSTQETARQIDALVRRHPDLSNQLYALHVQRGWERIG